MGNTGSKIKDSVLDIPVLNGIADGILGIVDFAKLNVEIIKEMVGLIPVLGKIMENLVPLIESGVNMISVLIVLAPLLLIFYAISYSIISLEK